jgi:hypothetical protein
MPGESLQTFGKTDRVQFVTKTPFDKFKEALSIVVAVPKSTLPKTTKKPKKK